MPKQAIYTVITNNYDTLNEVRFPNKSFDYICFTDNPDLKSKTWQIRVANQKSRHLQREIKILHHKYLPEYDLTIYIDANMIIRNDLSSLVRYASEDGLLLIKHPKRNCVYQEAEAVLMLNKDVQSIVNPQIEKYRLNGFQKNKGMFATGLMVRKNNPAVNNFCEIWWNEVKNHSHRDQLSVTYALDKSNIKVKSLSYNMLNYYVNLTKHINPFVHIDKNKLIKVTYSTPGRSDKNIGKAYNDFMMTVNNGEWVCIRDGDTMFMSPDWCKHIEDIIKENGNRFDLIGCVTNRLGGKSQLIDGMFNEDSITKHLDVANQIRSNDVVPIDAIAGLCLIFKKDVWDKVKFQEKSITFDTQFSHAVKKAGFKIGLATGLYLLHLYRWGQPNPRTYKKHLL